MSIIFGYDKIQKGKILNNGYKFINNKPPVNLGFCGCNFKNIKIPESILFNEKKLNDYLNKNNIKLDENSILEGGNHWSLTKWFDINIKQINQINNKDKYYYIIDIMDISFFNNLNEASQLNLSKKVIDDIKNKRSKILVLCCMETIIDIENIYEIFNSWVKKFNISLDSIIFSSGDYSIDKYKNIEYIPFSIFEHTFKDIYIKEKINESRVYIKRKIQKRIKRSKIFLNYNRRPTLKRCKLVYKLQQQNLFEYGLVSLGWKKELLDDQIKNHFPDNFLNTFPISFDDSDLHSENLFLTLNKEDFLDTYVSLVSESLVKNNVIFPTEKIWKPIIFYHPFIVISEVGFLQQLRKFGYKTFSKWFDESYDQELNENKRLNMVINEVKKLTEMSHEELQNMLVDMLPTLKHNYKTFLKRGTSIEFQNQLISKLNIGG